MLRTTSIEALLFSASGPLEKKRLAALLGTRPERLKEALGALRHELAGRGIRLVETADEVELRSAPEEAEMVKKLRESELSRDLGRAGLETLAVIAYRNGVTRGEVDWVRGVNSSTSLRSLLLRGLIEGREDEADRRRTRYRLTTEALGYLGVSRAEELPRFAELSAAATVPPPVSAAETA